MALQRTIICITGAFLAVGFAASQAGAGLPLPCDFEIEINALRGGSPTVTVGVDETKNITAKARIIKGTALSGTTIDTKLLIEAFDGLQLISFRSALPIQLEVGKGGQGAKFSLRIPQCDSGSIDFVATFTGTDELGGFCEATRSINKTCK